MTATREERWFEGGEPPAGAEPRRIPWKDLRQLARDGVEPPELIAGDMLYRGGLHSLAGPPDAGKTTLLLWWILDILREGGVVFFIDEEGGDEVVVERLTDLGATPEELEGLRYIDFAALLWDDSDIAGFLQDLGELGADQPILIAVDSAGAALASAGRNENEAADVIPFYKGALLQLARSDQRPAVAVLDHVTKDGGNNRYARGSGGKLQAVDVAYALDLVTPFSRNQNGLVKLTVTKDRRGYLHRKHDVAVLVGEPLRLQFTRDDKTTSSGPVVLAGFRTAARKLLAALATAHQRSQDEASTSRAQLTVPETVDLVAELFGHGLNWDNSKGDLNALLRAELVDKVEGVGRQRALWFATPAGLEAAAADLLDDTQP